jgi:hypothetical protein
MMGCGFTDHLDALAKKSVHKSASRMSQAMNFRTARVKRWYEANLRTGTFHTFVRG